MPLETAFMVVLSLINIFKVTLGGPLRGLLKGPLRGPLRDMF